MDIRAATQADLPAITDIYNYAVRETTATFDTEEKTVENRTAWLQDRTNLHPVLVADENNTIKGWASLNRWSDRAGYDGTVELSVYVAKKYHGQGIGKALMKEIVAAGSKVPLYTLISRITTDNYASIHIHRELGFRDIGVMYSAGVKFNRLLDVLFMQYVYSRELR